MGLFVLGSRPLPPFRLSQVSLEAEDKKVGVTAAHRACVGAGPGNPPSAGLPKDKGCGTGEHSALLLQCQLESAGWGQLGGYRKGQKLGIGPILAIRLLHS